MTPSKKKILLVQQDTGRRTIDYPIFPLGLAYLAAALNSHQVKIFDPNLYDLESAKIVLENELVHFQPDIVGISLRNIDTVRRRDPYVYFKTLAPMIRMVKEISPEVKIIVGGSAFSLYAQEIMRRIENIDFGVYLEGEETIVELLENMDVPGKVKGLFFREKGKIHFTGERLASDFNLLSAPRRDGDFINLGRYVGDKLNTIGVQSKRGCVLRCAYCTYVFLNKGNLRLRTPLQVADEIETMAAEQGIRRFTFADNVFNLPEEHARGICREIIRRKLPVDWQAWLTPKGLTEEFLVLLREAGCKAIKFSSDAATNRGLNVLSKGHTVQDIEDSIRLLSKIKDLAVGYYFLCAYPNMTWSDVLHTLRLILKIFIRLPARSEVHLNWIRIEPHTEIYNIALQEHVISKETNLLPEKEDELTPLFYAPRRFSFFTRMFDFILSYLEKRRLQSGVKRVYSN